MAVLIEHKNRKDRFIRVRDMKAGQLARLGKDGQGDPIVAHDNANTLTWAATNIITGSPVHFTCECVPLSPKEMLSISN